MSNVSISRMYLLSAATTQTLIITFLYDVILGTQANYGYEPLP